MKGYIIGKFDSKKAKWDFYSDLFDTYEEASTKASKLGSKQYDIFESVRHEDPQLESMTLSDYKHGLILTTHKNDKRWGMPYLFGKQYDGGWWNSNANGWFFRLSTLDDLISWGAKYDTDIPDNLESDEDSLEGMTLTSCGKGFLLTCHRDNPDYGIKYLYGETADSGWWMPNNKGWFFKSSWLDYLLKCGAVLGDNSSPKKTKIKKDKVFLGSSDDPWRVDINLVGMTLNSYGKGFLLRCDPSRDSWGIDYLYGKSAGSGWWMPRSNGWFFKSSWLDYLLAHGAVLVDNSDEKKTHTKDDKRSDDKVETNPHSLDGMSIKYFGKGLILTCKTNHPSYQVPYLFGKTFDGGWWNESSLGWFFKTDHLDYLIDRGAKLIDSKKSHTAVEYDEQVWQQYMHDRVSLENDDLSNMELINYKNSYLLIPKESDHRYGMKYLFGQSYGSGWWNQNLGGWIFRKSFKDDLFDKGAVVQ